MKNAPIGILLRVFPAAVADKSADKRADKEVGKETNKETNKEADEKIPTRAVGRLKRGEGSRASAYKTGRL